MQSMNIPILRLPYTDEDIEFIKEGIVEVLLSGYLTMGKKVAQFEKAFAEFIGTRHAIGTNSGTSSLEIVMRAIGVEGATVVIPSNTFMATATAVTHAGARIIFTDCQEENLQMDPADLQRKIQPDTKGVVLVHIGGMISPNIDEIKRICDENSLFLLEDAAHAHGATIDGRRAGSLGIGGSFSFYPTKVMTTGEGGMVTTDDEEIYRRCLVLRDHGKTNPELNVHEEFGYNWRFSEFHALLGLQQMKRIESSLEERRRIAKMYDERLGNLPKVKRLQIPSNIRSSYYKYIVFLDEHVQRDELKTKMKDRYGISLPGEVYSQPLHTQPVFRKHSWAVANDPGDAFPQTEYVCEHHLCLPLYLGLTEEEIDYVVDSLARVLR